MADEATVKQGKYGDMYYTVADATAIAKGSLMVLSEGASRTAVKHSAELERFVGIALMEKEANDGQTEMAVQTTGLAKIESSGTIDEGDIVVLSSTANQVAAKTGAISDVFLHQIVGVALEAGTGKILVKLGGALVG